MRYLNDGSGAPPRLRFDLNTGNLLEPDARFTGPRGPLADNVDRIRVAGFEGVQTDDRAPVVPSPLRATGMGRVVAPEEARRIAAAHKARGWDATTLHVGTGFETLDEARRLVDAVTAASDELGYPLFVETHRATVTQDIRFTLELVAHCPDMRFNADFSHWYAGQEMPYGDIGAKFDAMEPVFARVGFLHGRISNGACVQAAIGIEEEEPHVAHFAEMWRRCFASFRATARPGDYLVFAPELLPAYFHDASGRRVWMHYARRFPQPDGTLLEESDRWEQALRLCDIARDAFADAAA